MKTNLPIPGQINHRAALECLHHRMMLRARHRARGGRWWWQQAQVGSARCANLGLQTVVTS